jgi:cell wall-associated NlpC family hydrolase
MTKAEKAVQLALELARDNTHGYSQSNRWGPDYDCSSFLIHVWEQAGVPVKTKGATYTGNMRGVFLRCGFVDVTSQVNLKVGGMLKPGDVLLNNRYHTALYVGGGNLVQASSNYDGKPGDSSGNEIKERSYYNYPWDCVLRYAGDGQAPAPKVVTYSIQVPLLKRGDKGISVKAMQGALIARGFSCGPEGADGDYGYNTRNAVKQFQLYMGLGTDGICGGETWNKLLGN